MAIGNFPRCQREVFAHEGGYTANPKDPGNWTGGKVGKGQLKGTKFGIAANTYPNEDIRNLTKERAYALYERDFWRPLPGDSLAVGLDLAAYDVAVNSGGGRAKKLLLTARTRASDPVGQIKALCAARLAFMQGLRTWSTFGKGWQRRVAHVQATAVRWALEGAGKAPAEVKAELERQGRVEERKAEKAAQNAGTATAGGAAGSGGTAVQVPADAAVDPLVVAAVVAAFALLVVIALVHRARAKRAGADAFKAAAAAVRE